MTLMHASCVAIDGRAVLIVGPSGSGKSDLALRLIDRGAVLVSDDQVRLEAEDGQVFARPPATIAGKIEVRGVGIVAMPHAAAMPVALLIDLAADPERMPDIDTKEVCGVALPAVALKPLEVSAAIKVELCLRNVGLGR